MNKYNIGDIVTYIGSDDEWNHECCIGEEYEITYVHRPVCGIYYYDMKSTLIKYDFDLHNGYPNLNSVLEYQIENKKC